MIKDNKEQNIIEYSQAIEEWKTFAKNNTIITPENINNDIWKGIEQNRIQKRRIIGTIAIAASIFALLLINHRAINTQTYEQKEALLTEALEMFSDNKKTSTKSEIIYEDELIVIYSQLN